MSMTAETRVCALVLACMAWLGSSTGEVRAADLPIFDAHLHYSHDAWETVPPKEAIAILRKAGLK